MIVRCTKTEHPAYRNYGGRGITICPEWFDFRNFVRDMGLKPPGLTIERIDNDKGYYKENCKWADHGEQARNTRNAVKVARNGETKCIAEWSRELGIGNTTLFYRLKHGLDVFDPDTSMGKAALRRTHCPSGHLYDQSNTYIQPNGHRKCRTCNRIRAQALRDKAKLRWANGFV